MGVLENLYIWERSSGTIELGMFYEQKGKQKKSFPICSIELQEYKTHNFFHHKVSYSENSGLWSEYLIIVVESLKTKEISLQIYEILSKNISLKLNN